MRAIVLSAGYGTRLWPLTEDRTKPAIPILGKPLVGYVAEYLAAYGIDEIVVNLHLYPNVQVVQKIWATVAASASNFTTSRNR